MPKPVGDGSEVVGSVMVVGGGIGGVQSALDLADSGYLVYLVEEKPSIGGVMAQLDKTFPTNDCSMCILSPKLVEAGRHPNISIITLGQVDGIDGQPGNLSVRLTRKARYVDGAKCTGCGLCTQNCPVRYEVYTEPTREIPVVVTSEDITRVDGILDKHRTKKGPLMPVLKDLNKEYGYLPENLLRYVAKDLATPLSLIYRIVTFYSAFSLVPRGRHIINICMGTTCYVRGAGKLLEMLEEQLNIPAGQTTADRRFSLETVRCLGCCSLAPVITVDGETYGKLDQNKVLEILEQYE